MPSLVWLGSTPTHSAGRYELLQVRCPPLQYLAICAHCLWSRCRAGDCAWSAESFRVYPGAPDASAGLSADMCSRWLYREAPVPSTGTTSVMTLAGLMLVWSVGTELS